MPLSRCWAVKNASGEIVFGKMRQVERSMAVALPSSGYNRQVLFKRDSRVGADTQSWGFPYW